MVRLFSLAGDRTLELDFPDVLHNLRLALVRAQEGRAGRGSDDVCRQALDNVADTLRTKSRGLIYEYRSQDPRVQSAADELSMVCGSHEAGQKGFRKVGLEDIGRCVRYLKRQFEEAGTRGASYLDLAAQVVAEEYRAAERKGLVEGHR